MASRTPNGLARIDSFESLRGIMALWVLAGHVALTFSAQNLEPLFLWRILAQNGRAVYVFMMLSGFVIFYLLNTKKEDYANYILRRFLRIFPAYFICLIISALMLPASLEAVTAFANASPRNLGRISYLSSSLENFIPHFVAHLTMLHGLLPSGLLPHTDWAILGQAWSISVEWQFYLIAPLLLAAVKQKSRLRALFILLLITFPLAILGRKLGDGFLGNHLFYFTIGCASAIYWFDTPKWNHWLVRHPNVSIPLLGIVCFIMMPKSWEISIWAVVFTSALVSREGYGKISAASVISNFLHLAPLRYLGKISYSIYLVHMIPLFGTLWFLKGSDLPQTTLLSITMASTIIFTLIFSACIYRWIEYPFINLGRRLILSNQPAR